MLFHEYLLQHYPENQVILKNKNIEYTVTDIIDRCNLFAASFKRAGIAKGDRVVLLMENGLDAICLQLCCSRLGAVFIPASPFEPVTRILKIIDQYRPVAVLVEDARLKTDFAPYFPISCAGEEVVTLQQQDHDGALCDDRVKETDLLYIISTSGTTGNPKGIKMSHKAVVCFFEALVQHCKLEHHDNVGSISPLQFDFSLLDLGLAWGSKACLTVYSQSFAYSPKKLVEAIIANKVTQFDCVPAIWNMIIRFAYDDIERLTNLHSILYAGDKFTVKNIGLLREKLPWLRIINCFGQSESIACSFYDIENMNVDSYAEIPIGKGFAGSTFYIVDSNGMPVTENNVQGELWLSNGSLFSGYWENEALTNQRLIKDPFNPLNPDKIYKSGDLLSRGNDGNYYFHGRMDSQIKVNGNRVELDEIEQAVLKYEHVADAAAVAEMNNDTASVILYVSVASENYIEEEAIRKHCRASLPLYMIPSRIVMLTTPFPLNANGKTDKKKLLQLTS